MCSSNHFCCGNVFSQGDRFGGALDAAARLFSHGVDSGQAPMEFVNDMRKKGQFIMGIGHRVKSVSKQRAEALMLIWVEIFWKIKGPGKPVFSCVHNHVISLPL